jgi:hypothetical protein
MKLPTNKTTHSAKSIKNLPIWLKAIVALSILVSISLAISGQFIAPNYNQWPSPSKIDKLVYRLKTDDLSDHDLKYLLELDNDVRRGSTVPAKILEGTIHFCAQSIAALIVASIFSVILYLTRLATFRKNLALTFICILIPWSVLDLVHREYWKNNIFPSDTRRINDAAKSLMPK